MIMTSISPCYGTVARVEAILVLALPSHSQVLKCKNLVYDRLKYKGVKDVYKEMSPV